jgi:CheY-like chemotaxis protein
MTSLAPPPARLRLQWFQDLMRHRIMEILLVAPPYDSFVLEEAGELAERMLGEFRNLDLHYAPGLTSVATGAEALERLAAEERFNLVVTTPQLADMHAVELARRVRAAGRDVPVVLLARDGRELADFTARQGTAGLERAFLWQGDARILVAIVKSVEDRHNAPHDCRELGVPVLLLVEDGVRQYSSFLPAMYTELLHHAQRVIAEGLNLSQKILRMRARPKILLCTSWEEADSVFDTYAEQVLGIVADVEFPRAGALSTAAGADFARRARASHPDIPVILHSSQPDNRRLAESLGASFLQKGSAHLLQDLGRVMLEDFGFGDFVFRLPDGVEVDRAADLKGLEEKLASVPEAAIVYHAERNHFSRWLKARAVFQVAEALRPRRLEEFPSVEALRRHLAQAVGDYRREQARALVADFDRTTFDFESDFYRIGGGSLGGKARGLAFVRRLLAERGLTRRFTGVEIAVPAAVVLGTDVFDRFLDENGLRHFAIECDDDEEIARRFAAAPFPAEAERDLAAFLAKARFPLAVRSSSLLEDSQHQPFTGVYDTCMLANDGADDAARLARALAAIRRVYASTFTRAAKGYLKATTYRLEEERMAVIVQRVVGTAHGERFYPTLSGVARSINFYPTGPMRAEDGVAAVALGMGRTVVDGSACLRFCPRHPQHLTQLATVREALATTQRRFWALPLSAAGAPGESAAMREVELGLEVAEADGELVHVGSTCSPDDDRLVDGLARSGTRIVSFAPILKHGRAPLAELLATLLDEGARGMGAPVEIEFALRLSPTHAAPDEFGLLQMRPLAIATGGESADLGEIDEGAVVCRSASALGNGRIDGLTDLVVVDPRRFERGRSRESAAAIGRINARLLAERRPYVLLGLGRWGSRDPWLGSRSAGSRSTARG